MYYSESGEASRKLALMMKTVILSTNFAEKGAKPLLEKTKTLTSFSWSKLTIIGRY